MRDQHRGLKASDELVKLLLRSGVHAKPSNAQDLETSLGDARMPPLNSSRRKRWRLRRTARGPAGKSVRRVRSGSNRRAGQRRVPHWSPSFYLAPFGVIDPINSGKGGVVPALEDGSARTRARCGIQLSMITRTSPDARMTSRRGLPLLVASMKSTLAPPSFKLRTVMVPASAGTTGLTSRTVPWPGSNFKPSIEANSESGVPAAQACGEQAAG